MNRRIVLRDAELMNRAVDAIFDIDLTGELHEVIIRPHVPSYTRDQQNFYRSLCGQLAAEFGYTHDEMHDVLRRQFLAPSVVEWNGELIEVLPSTTSLNRKQMSALIDRVIEFAAEYGIELDHQEAPQHAGEERESERQSA